MSTKAAIPIAIKAAAMTNIVESGECVLSHNDLCLCKLVPPGTQLQLEADVAPDPQSEHGYAQHHQSEAKLRAAVTGNCAALPDCRRYRKN